MSACKGPLNCYAESRCVFGCESAVPSSQPETPAKPTLSAFLCSCGKVVDGTKACERNDCEWPRPKEKNYRRLLEESDLPIELAVEIADLVDKAQFATTPLTMPRMDEILLACGEMTAGEQRAVKAALGWFIRRVDGGNDAK